MVGTLPNGLRVLVFRNNVLEGFSCEEAVFFARLLGVLGIKAVLQTFIVGTLAWSECFLQIPY